MTNHQFIREQHIDLQTSPFSIFWCLLDVAIYHNFCDRCSEGAPRVVVKHINKEINKHRFLYSRMTFLTQGKFYLWFIFEEKRGTINILYPIIFSFSYYYFVNNKFLLFKQKHILYWLNHFQLHNIFHTFYCRYK